MSISPPITCAFSIYFLRSREFASLLSEGNTCFRLCVAWPPTLICNISTYYRTRCTYTGGSCVPTASRFPGTLGKSATSMSDIRRKRAEILRKRLAEKCRKLKKTEPPKSGMVEYLQDCLFNKRNAMSFFSQI